MKAISNLKAASGPEAPIDCALCPRLVEFREANAEKFPDYFNGAVPSFAPSAGDGAVRLLVVGLAPGLHGANKTARPFTGDYAGDLLYDTLREFGFSSGDYAGHADDGLDLTDAMITNAVRCVPPENKPVGAEATACRPFLTDRIKSLPNLRIIICLGKISHDNTVRALGERVAALPFGHGTRYELKVAGKDVTLLSSYHCSRYNTNTRRLTEEMFYDIFRTARAVLS